MEKKVNEVDKNNGKISKNTHILKKSNKKNKKTKTQLNFENSVKIEQ